MFSSIFLPNSRAVEKRKRKQFCVTVWWFFDMCRRFVWPPRCWASERPRFFWPAPWQGKRTPAARLARLLTGQALGRFPSRRCFFSLFLFSLFLPSFLRRADVFLSIVPILTDDALMWSFEKNAAAAKWEGKKAALRSSKSLLVIQWVNNELTNTTTSRTDGRRPESSRFSWEKNSEPYGQI